MPRLLEWLEERRPDGRLPPGDQDAGTTASRPHEFEKIGYKAIWHGQKGFNGVAILADGAKPVEIQRGLGGDPEDEQSRYIEADVGGVRICNLYLPNGNPQPGPQIRLQARPGCGGCTRECANCCAAEVPAVVLGDFNVIPEDKDTCSVRAMAMTR